MIELYYQVVCVAFELVAALENDHDDDIGHRERLVDRIGGLDLSKRYKSCPSPFLKNVKHAWFLLEEYRYAARDSNQIADK